MATDRWRLPAGMRTTSRIPIPRAATGSADPFPEKSEKPPADLFPQLGENHPHPDFAARAAIWRDQAAGVISLAEARRRSSTLR